MCRVCVLLKVARGMVLKSSFACTNSICGGFVRIPSGHLSSAASVKQINNAGGFL